MKIVGIDYGSKLAGTSVIAFCKKNQQVSLFQSEKKKDADKFILEKLASLNPDIIGIDAPLSLPGVYRKLEGYDDYFYRKGDKEVKGMSPMFLGGLTARAMKLINAPFFKDKQILEIYPGALARHLELKELSYKKEKSNIPVVLNYLVDKIPFDLPKENITNWHQVDAILALWSVWRFQNSEHIIVGNKDEGQIVF